jgi:hypothetical protein
VEEPVGERVRLQARHGVGGLIAGTREHVMPLEYLVQHDAVKQPSGSAHAPR